MSVEGIVYTPALRMKAGEMSGMSLLAADVADCVFPRFIVPPAAERDDTNQGLFDSESKPDVAPLLGTSWRRASYLDFGWVIDEFGRDRIDQWLPQLFERARNAGCEVIPLASLNDISAVEAPAFREAVGDHRGIKFALQVPVNSLENPDVADEVRRALELLRLSPRNCTVIADFAGSDFSMPAVVAEIITGVLEELQEIGRWRQIVFQGTNYPEVNPAIDGGIASIGRNEWMAWKMAVRFNPSTADHMIFGDYGADCSKINFSKSGARAIPHIRYTTDTKWEVVRGRRDGQSTAEMRNVYQRIVESTDFAGARFSQADSYIFNAARDSRTGCGNSTTWRQLNTTHHITQVVRNLAEVRGISIGLLPDVGASTQIGLFG
jgi:hypothetical protein